MRRLQEGINQIRALFRSETLFGEVDMELEQHIEFMVDELVARGMTRDEARRAAYKKFGHVQTYKDRSRDAWGNRIVLDTLRDIRLAVRSLRKSPSLMITILATISLCIGANATILSTLYGVVLKRLPFEGSDRLVQIYNVFPGERVVGSHAGWGQYVDFNQHADLFDGFVLYKLGSKIANDMAINVSSVSPNFFDFLGVTPVVGRNFAPEEFTPGFGRVVMLTHTMWEQQYQADPNVVGQEVDFLDEPPYTIVGVAPRAMEAFDATIRLFVPLPVTAPPSGSEGNRHAASTSLWGRLKPGVTREQAYNQLVAVERRAIEETGVPRQLEDFDDNPEPFQIGRPHPLQSSLFLLQIGAAFLAIVGFINVVNLLLSRALRRRAELSLRRSLGAGRLALARMMVVESLLLMIGGVSGGALLTWIGLTTCNRFLTQLFPATTPIGLSGTVSVAILLIAIAGGLTMGLLPFVLLWRWGGIERPDKLGFGGGGSPRLASHGLVVLQVAVTITLVIGAGLMVRSWRNVLGVDPGFDAGQVIVGRVNMASNYRRPRDRFEFRRRTMEAMRGIPGVDHASFDLESSLIVGTFINRDGVAIRGGASNGENEPRAVLKHVDGEYFATMGIDIVEGRAFRYGDDDCDEGAPDYRTSYVVGERFADLYLHGRPAVGAEMLRGGLPATDDGWLRVVGVAARANLEGLEQRDGLPVLYICAGPFAGPRFTILVRTQRASESVIRAMRAALRDQDPTLHLFDAAPLNAQFDALHLGRQVATLLIGVFAGIALLLSAVGVYGVLSYDIEQRRREMGIRSAVGANRHQLLSLLLIGSLRKTGVGLVLGVLASLYLSRFLENRLFDVGAVDPWTYVVGVIVLLFVAFLASYLPARTALKIQPVEAIRLE